MPHRALAYVRQKGKIRDTRLATGVQTAWAKLRSNTVGAVPHSTSPVPRVPQACTAVRVLTTLFSVGIRSGNYCNFAEKTMTASFAKIGPKNSQGRHMYSETFESEFVFTRNLL